MNNFEKPIWEKIPGSYDLKVKNPQAVDVVNFSKLLKDVEDSSANWRKNIRFNQRAAKAFCQWFCNPKASLPGYAYALLSNWFLTSLKFVRKSPRGVAALKFWKAMFCAVPEKRLTCPKRNYKIRSGEFALWWEKQKDCQTRK